ncbi:TPA: hypothetical protein HA265_06230, partial [Candidatus Woesearchaeota archaeon]|nr:hypothetical protein [Candidatus Woesearchaeota archaeon]
MVKNRLSKKIAEKIPDLDLKLAQAGMPDTKEEFIKKTILTAFYMTAGITLFMFFLLSKTKAGPGVLIAVFPILLVMMFFYFLKYPDVKIMKLEKDIDKEIVYAGRFIVIELESGIPIYEAFKQVNENYPTIGRYFNNIIHDIDLGTP